MEKTTGGDWSHCLHTVFFASNMHICIFLGLIFRILSSFLTRRATQGGCIHAAVHLRCVTPHRCEHAIKRYQIGTGESMDSRRHHPSKHPYLMTPLLSDSISIDPTRATFKSGVVVINYSCEYGWKPGETWGSRSSARGERGGGSDAGAVRAGTKACHEGSCLPPLQTHMLPGLCRQRLGPPRQISPGGYYRTKR